MPADRLPGARWRSAAYYVAAEGLANAVKHATASHVTIAVERDDGRVVVEVADDGRGGADARGERPAWPSRPRRGARRQLDDRAAPAAQRHDGARRTAMRVILADDAVVIREGLARLLVEAGIEIVAQVGDADALRDAVRADPPDVALVDIRMPPTFTDDGLRAAEQIRAEQPDGRGAAALPVRRRRVRPASSSRRVAGGSATCSRTASSTRPR